METMGKLEEFKKEFDKIFFEFLAKKEQEAEKLTPFYGNLIKEIKRFAKTGGKRLRPAFVFYGYKAAGGKDTSKVWSACLAIELIHTFALIHDDIMDCSEFRRGKPATWKFLGKNQAILVGDLAFALAEELMSEFVIANFPAPHTTRLQAEAVGPFAGRSCVGSSRSSTNSGQARRMNSANTKRVLRYFNLLNFEVIGGQYLDIASNTPPRCAKALLGGGRLKEADVIKIMDLKSGRYTIARPLQIGAAMVGANKKILEKLFEYGVNLGIAFQIQDDILGTFGDEKVIGKPAGSDLKEGKRTLLAIKLKERVLELKSFRVLEKFNRVFGNKNLTKADLEWVKKLMVKLQVLDYCQSEARQLINKAKRALGDIKLEKESKEFLIGVADYILERKS